MNKRCFRHKFNKTTGQLCVVAEGLGGIGRSSRKRRLPAKENKNSRGGFLNLSLAALSLLLGLSFNNASLAQIVVDPNAPKNQQPNVLNTPNGLPLVNIQTPSSAGVSRNTYIQLDVGTGGAVFNNSRTNVQTQLGGWVQGNPLLSGGTARIILNEVNSTNPSVLRGYLEVAGDRAQFIIANPSGITCIDCGFINASRATITTGRPIISGGSLQSYLVEGGAVDISGSYGLDTSGADFTDIIARSVKLNSAIWANDLKVSVGANTVNAAHTSVTKSSASGAKPTYGIDVGHLGGMYAGKIKLVGTEDGVGVRNAGKLSASSGGMTLTADGRLVNTGSIQTKRSDTKISSKSEVQNSGSIVSEADIDISTSQRLLNSSVIHAHANVTLSPLGNLENSGRITAANNVTVNASGTLSRVYGTGASIFAAGVNADGTIGDHGTLVIDATDQINLFGQNYSGTTLALTSGAIDLSGSLTTSDVIRLTAIQNSINLKQSEVIAETSLEISTPDAVINDGGDVETANLSVNASGLSNVSGTIRHTGSNDLNFSVSGDINNMGGTIASNGTSLTFGASTLTNTDGSMTHAGSGALDMDVASFFGARGTIVTNGNLDLAAATLILDGAGTESQGRVNIDSATFSHRGGTLVQAGQADGQIKATTKLDNTGGTIDSAGTLQAVVGGLTNQGGTIQVTGSEKDLTIKASGAVDNHHDSAKQGDIYASGDLTLEAAGLDNTQSQISAGGAVDIISSGSIDNASGRIIAEDGATVSAASIDNAQGKIGATGAGVDLTATSGKVDNSLGRIEAKTTVAVRGNGLDNESGIVLGQSLELDAGTQALNNQSGQVIASGQNAADKLNIKSGALNNDQGLIQAASNLNVDTQGQVLTNTGSGAQNGILAQGNTVLKTGALNNTAGYIGSEADLQLVSTQIDNRQSGVLLSGQEIDISGTGLDNRDGQIKSVSDTTIHLGSGTLDNTASLIRAGGHAEIIAKSVINAGTGLDPDNTGIEANTLDVTAAQTIDNMDGSVRTDGQLNLTAGLAVNNTRGRASSTSSSVLVHDINTASKNLAITNTDGELLANQALNIDSASLTGDGKLYSSGSIDALLIDTFTNTGEVTALGTVKLHTLGDVENHTKIVATQELNLNAAAIDNKNDAELKAQTVKLKSTSSTALTNRGLLDAGMMQIDAVTLNNLGTGRIYGDHTSISATTLNNTAENNVAPVIAARQRLDIGAGTLNNLNHALIFSDGDLNMGGSLDEDRHATGQGTILDNGSATIEALGQVSLSFHSITNRNLSIATESQSIGSEAITEYKLNAGDVYRPSNTTSRYTPDEVTIFDCQALCLRVNATGDTSDAFTQYSFTRSESQDVVASSEPGQILSGGDMVLTADVLNNDKSEIIAGGNINSDVDELNNISITGEKIQADSGTATSFWRKRKKGRDTFRTSTTSYQPAPVVETISLRPATYDQNTAPIGTGTDLEALDNDLSLENYDGPSNNSEGPRSVLNPNSILRFDQKSGEASSTASFILITELSNQVPNNSLFNQDPAAPNGYIIETDPAFASYRNWLSSDYLLSTLSADPTLIQKRLGDGFYEQKLIREQIGQLTGRRFLEGYSSDEEQYRQLMLDGAAFAQKYNLRPGVSLSAEHMADLTTNIVWLETQTIQLSSGEQVEALVPRVYVRANGSEPPATDGMIASDKALVLAANGDLNNFGNLTGHETVQLSAENVNNIGGRIASNNIQVAAVQDVINLGGELRARDTVAVTAGRDITIESTTRTQTGPQGTRTNVGRIAKIEVEGPGAILNLNAGRDTTVSAAQLDSAGSTNIVAGRDVTLETVEVQADNRVTWDRNNYSREFSSADVGTTIQSEDDLNIVAGRDVNATAAQVNSEEGTLRVTATEDINIKAGQSVTGVDEASKHKSKGFLSSRTLTTKTDVEITSAQGSSFGGDKVELTSGEDILVEGSRVLATDDVDIEAKGDVDIVSAASTIKDKSYRKDKKSGLMSGGGFGVFIGKRVQTGDTKQGRVQQNTSTIGSTSGDVNIKADDAVTIAASDILTREGDIAISGNEVNLEARNNTTTLHDEQRFEQTGLTISLSGGVIDTIETIKSSAERIDEVEDDKLKALHAWRIARAAEDLPGQLETLSNAENLADTGISLNVSIGKTESTTTRQHRTSTALGSSILSEGNVDIIARGDKETPNSGDITSEGTLIRGDHITLDAKDEVILKSAENTETDNTKSRSKSIGLGLTIGADGAIGATVNASVSRGEINQSSDRYLETLIEGETEVAIKSGSDTTLEGAQVKAERVTADIGGDLNITSQQDEETYKNRQKSAGISLTVGPNSVSGSVNLSNLKADSNYKSVQEQSGIFAGEDGYDIEVAGNTALKGAAIVSEADADKNRLSTETLSVDEIRNVAEFDIESQSIGLSFGGSGPAGLSGGFAKDEGKAANTTYSAVSEGTLDIRSNPNAVLDPNLKRSKEQAHKVLERIFDPENDIKALEEQMEAVQIFAEEGYRLVGDLYKPAEDARVDVELARENGASADEIKELEDKAAKLEAQLPNKAIAHAIVGGLAASLGGGDFLQGAAAAGLNEVASKELAEHINDPLTRNFISTLIGGAVGGTSGAIITGTADKFNRQLHLSEKKLIEKKAALFAEQIGLCAEAQNCAPQDIELAQKLLTRQALRQVDLKFSKQFEENETARAFLKKVGAAKRRFIFFGTPERFVAKGDTFEDHYDGIKNIYQLQDLYKTAIGEDAVRTLKILNVSHTSSAVRALTGTRDGSVDTLDSMIDLAIVLGTEPGKLIDIATQIYENPEILLEGMIEPFKDRYDVGDIAGAVGYALPAIIEAVVGTKGAAAGAKAAKAGAKAGAKIAKAGVDDLVKYVGDVATKSTVKVDVDKARIKNSSDWKHLNEYKPNTKYELSNGDSFVTNANGQVTKQTYYPKNEAGKRTSTQTEVGKEGVSGDVGGHGQPCTLGGTCDRYNLFPENGKLNNGPHKAAENRIRKEFKAGNLDGPVTIKYNNVDPKTGRPEKFQIEFKVKDSPDVVRYRFDNTAPSPK